MAYEVDPNSCERTPEAIRAALQRRPDWLQAFEQDWLSAAADFQRRIHHLRRITATS